MKMKPALEIRIELLFFVKKQWWEISSAEITSPSTGAKFVNFYFSTLWCMILTRVNNFNRASRQIEIFILYFWN